MKGSRPDAARAGHVLGVVLAASALLVPLCRTYGITVPDEKGFSMRVSGWSSIDSAYVSKGRTCHDGLVWNPSVTIADFAVGDWRLPAYIGYWGMFSLSDTDKFPREKPGRWIEADPYAGVDFAKVFGWEELVVVKSWWLRWHFPATGRKSTDMCALDVTLKKIPLHPTTSWRYRFHGASRGRVEIKFGVSDEYVFFEDWRVFGGLNLWYIDYRNENADRRSGPSCGDLSAGLGWKCLYFKTSYWFQLDHDVLKKGSNPYDYDENLIFSVGVRFAF